MIIVKAAAKYCANKEKWYRACLIFLFLTLTSFEQERGKDESLERDIIEAIKRPVGACRIPNMSVALTRSQSILQRASREPVSTETVGVTSSSHQPCTI